MINIADYQDYRNIRKHIKKPKAGVFCEDCGLELERGLCSSCIPKKLQKLEAEMEAARKAGTLPKAVMRGYEQAVEWLEKPNKLKELKDIKTVKEALEWLRK